jgi:hypothetical protein
LILEPLLLFSHGSCIESAASTSGLMQRFVTFCVQQHDSQSHNQRVLHVSSHVGSTPLHTDDDQMLWVDPPAAGEPGVLIQHGWGIDCCRKSPVTAVVCETCGRCHNNAALALHPAWDTWYVACRSSCHEVVLRARFDFTQLILLFCHG